MRPIQLKIAGLHSFREMQEVDFATLCQGGVFGIFGPTGSGKSTILDAMTLALYGKVERANNNTTGIMNHAEDRVYVSYTFELRNANGVKRYQAERSYKRSDEFRLRSTTARLIAISDGEQVLADKDREVTAKIEEILGLTAEDFTRAVVLPQGKFAEFLMLQGSERRRMLQRLFQLEKYGDRLLARLKQRKEQAEIALKEIVAEQAGLGDCSDERVQELKQRQSNALQMAKYWRSHLEKIERLYLEKQEIWHKQMEKQRIEHVLQQLHREEEGFVLKEQQIERAKQAERIYPYLEQWMRDDEQLRYWQGRFDETGQAYAEHQTLHEQHQRNYDRARLKRGEEEPKLVIQIETFKQAQVVSQQLEQLYVRQKEQRLEYEKLLREKESIEQEIQLIQQKLERAKNLQQELQREAEQKMVPADERERVTRALQLKHQWDAVKQELFEMNQELTHKLENLNSLQKDEQIYQSQLQNIHVHLSQEVDLLVLLQQQWMDFVREIMQTETRAVTALKNLQKRHLEEERKTIAHQLALQLQKGAPCPVCGSTEHPNPIKMEPIAFHTAAEIEQLELLLVQLREVEQRSNQHLFEIEQLAKMIESIKTNTIVKEIAYVHENEVEIQASIVELSLDQVRLWNEKMDKLIQRWDELQVSLQKLLAERNDLEKRYQELSIHRNHLQQLSDELNEKVRQKEEKCNELVSLWKEKYDDIDVATVEQLSFSLDQGAREVEQIQKRLLNGKQYVLDHEQQWQQKDVRLRELSIAMAKLEMELQGTDKSIGEYEEKIVEKTQGKNIQTLIQEASATLTKLKQDEEQSRIIAMESEQRLRKIEGEYKVAEQSLRTSQQQWECSRQKWEAELQRSDFSSKEEVVQSILSPEELNQLQQTIDAYREQCKVHEVQLSKLMEALQGHEMTVEQWNDVQQQLDQAKQEDERAIQELARADRDYEEMVEKHKRWQQLEQRRAEVSAEYERLLHLQSIFRGNAFVDFIAEEQLMNISRDASERLSQLTRGRYAIEVDSNGGFVIADHANGGVKRPVTTLSGGETFLTSLALALSLSAQVQLRGQYPLEFFFLDEGFGTLDQELLETVLTALEKLRTDSLSVGLISHVPELKERILRKIVVLPAETDGGGSKIILNNI